MTNEQLTQEVIKLAEHQARCDAERDNILMIIEELKDDVKSTKALTEDVHFMARNMESMQQTLIETNEKVEQLSQKDYNNYISNKKLIKDKIISGITGSIITALLGGIAILVQIMIKGGV